VFMILTRASLLIDSSPVNSRVVSLGLSLLYNLFFLLVQIKMRLLLTF